MFHVKTGEKRSFCRRVSHTKEIVLSRLKDGRDTLMTIRESAPSQFWIIFGYFLNFRLAYKDTF